MVCVFGRLIRPVENSSSGWTSHSGMGFLLTSAWRFNIDFLPGNNYHIFSVQPVLTGSGPKPGWLS
jgi:hypothetical protein